MTRAEVAQAVGGAGPSAVVQWERGTAAAERLRQQRLIELLDGRR